MPQIKNYFSFISRRSLRTSSKLMPVVFVGIFATIGVIYLLVTHAAVDTVSVQGTNSGLWYKDSASIFIGYSTTCEGATKVVVPIQAQGLHTYYVWQDGSGNPYLVQDGGQPNKGSTILGVKYCNPNTGYGEIWKAEFGVDRSPPSISFTSTGSTTQSSSIIVSGTASDTNSGVASVRINGVAATLSGGNFTANVPLSVGANNLVATATDVVGHTANSGVITMTRTVPPPANSTSGGSGSSSGGSGSGSGSSPAAPKSSSSGKSSSSSGHSTTTGTSAQASPGAATTDTTTPLDTSNPPIDSLNATDVASSSQPNVSADSTSTLNSADNVVEVTFPAGTFSVDAYCTIDTGNSKSVPVKSAKLIGPYEIFCSDGNGQSLATFNKSVTVTVATSSGKYAAYTNDSKWAKVASSSSGTNLSFKLVKAESFAVAPAKTISWGKIILNVGGALLLVLVIGGGILAIRRWRNQYASYDTYQ